MMRSSRRRESESELARVWPRRGVAVVPVAAVVLVSACSPEDAKGDAGEAAAVESASPATVVEGTEVTAPRSSSSAKDRTRSASTDSTSSSTSVSTKKSSKSKSSKGKGSTASSTSSPTSDTKLYRVIRVVDGDTVKVDIDGGESVRVIGIDTPETVHPDKPTECGGSEATAAARELLDGKKVAVVYDRTQDRRDKYGRLLAYLDIPESGDFGEAMLRKGHAEEYTYAAPYQRRETYRSAEQQARSAGRGVWGSCSTKPKQDATPSPKPSTSSTPAPSPTTQAPKAPAKPKAPATKAPAPPAKADAPGPGWTNDALRPGYTGCRQGYPGGKINGVYWWKPIAC